MNPPRHEIPLKPKPQANPGQIRAVDTRDDRLEIANLIGHLSPPRRLAFLAWVCSQATLPCSDVHPQPSSDVRRLAETAMRCDRANERLTMEVLLDCTHLAADYSLDLAAVLAELVRRVRAQR